jgi:DNA-binding response OmpR family regulator
MSTSPAILLVEDDPDLAALLRLHLEDLGFRCDHCVDGADGLARAQAGPYALVVLDGMLPTLDGLEVCKQLRATGSTTPVLMLTARGEEVDKVLGLEFGADDYVTKPFAVRELLARVKALLRRVELDRLDGDRAESGLAEPFTVGTLRIEPEKRRALLGGEPVELTAKEFELLTLFARHPGRVFPRMELLERVWGYTHEGYTHTVNSHINRLRAKIEPDPANPRYVRTVWGVGYRFAEPDELVAEPPAFP